jgi:UDP-glucose 4-epimerase
MTRWLLTGGAGYIGAHVARDMVASAYAARR